MGFIQMFTNYLNAVVGRNQEFEELIKAKDISRVKELFTTREALTAEAMKEYDPKQHDIMNRSDKILKNSKGERKGTLKRWKLPINYPQYINEISVVFIYGRPVKWTNQSEGTDKAFELFQDLVKRTRFDSKIRQCKRLAGAETQSAMLFRVFRNNENQPDCQIRVLAKSKGDEIYARWDMYENLVSFAWGYHVKDSSTETSYHFDIFTPDVIYRCKRVITGWEVVEEANPIGKIPVILFQQDKEWRGVEPLIEREEYIGSRTADTNDYFADPYFVVNADIKASKHKEVHDELLDRTANLFISIIGNVLCIALKGECNNLVVAHEFQEPFGEDVKETIENIAKAQDSGMLSTEGAIELNPLVKDKAQELQRLDKEANEAAQRQRDIFGASQNKDDVFGGAE